MEKIDVGNAALNSIFFAYEKYLKNMFTDIVNAVGKGTFVYKNNIYAIGKLNTNFIELDVKYHSAMDEYISLRNKYNQDRESVKHTLYCILARIEERDIIYLFPNNILEINNPPKIVKDVFKSYNIENFRLPWEDALEILNYYAAMRYIV